MRLLPFLLALMLVPGLVEASSQIAPRDGLWLSLPPDSVKCILLRLPQDAGLTTAGNYIFSVGCEPSPQETWADLSEQIVREVHENNTVLIPICFDTVGRNKVKGNCSTPYTITLSESYTGTTKQWRGGICVSEYADADIVEPGTASSGEDAKSILNDNTDMISAWFKQARLYTKPGEQAVFNLSVQSYAELNIVVSIQSSLGVSPGQARLSTSPGSPYHYREFSVTSPQGAGTYPITATASPEDCQESYCTKVVKGSLVVSQEDPPQESGFSVTMTPENIDIKEPREVLMTLTILNNEDAAISFTSSIQTDPDDARTGFRGETVEIGPHDSHTRVFMVTPGTSSKLYEITAKAVSGGITVSSTSFISIDELATDATRQAEGLDSQAQSDLSTFLTSHASSTYGSDLQEYGSLRESLASASEQQPTQNQSSDWMDEYRDYYESQDQVEDEDVAGIMWLSLPIAIVIFALIILMFLLRRRKGSGEKEEDVEYY